MRNLKQMRKLLNFIGNIHIVLIKAIVIGVSIIPSLYMIVNLNNTVNLINSFKTNTINTVNLINSNTTTIAVKGKTDHAIHRNYNRP